MSFYEIIKERNNYLYNLKREIPIQYSENAKRRGDKKSKFETAKFLAWDGEGLEHASGPQVYGLMANSNGDYIIDINGIDTESCLNFLTSDRYTKNTTHVCFGASYDVNMILRDVEDDLLRKLHKGNQTVTWKYFDLEYRPRKSFTVRRYKMEQLENGELIKCFDRDKGCYIYERVVTLWDVFGFFQAKFIKVLRDWTKGTKYEDTYKAVLKDIEEGKERRGNFNPLEVESFVLPYCLKECEGLRDVMHILQEYLHEAGLVLSRWDGAGAVAAAALYKYGVKSHIRIGAKLDIEPWPVEVELAAEHAYYGGWIEAFMFGHFERPVYHYDEISSYPDKTRKLLSLSRGYWEELELPGNMLLDKKFIKQLKNLPSFFLAHIEWKNGPLYGPCPFSWRNQLGTVSRPTQGKAWQWSPEIFVAYDKFPDMEFKIDKLYYFVPDEDCPRPFAFVEDLFLLRALLKKQGKGMEKVLKLVLNSLYGKLAQSLGYNAERKLKPPYHCIIYAGLITSMTRANLLSAAMQHPDQIISIATDGIYSLVPLDLDVSEGLGKWEYKYHESMTLVQPGFYWYSTKNTSGDIEEKHYYRGFNEGCVSRQTIIDCYKNGQKSIVLKTKRFVTLGAAIGLNDFSLWRTWREKDRELDLMMEKSSKRRYRGEHYKNDPLIFVARNKVYLASIFKFNPKLLESKKYQFNWDENREAGRWDGQTERIIAEEMFHMELCTDS